MRLSSSADDLVVFFDDAHRALAERARAALFTASSDVKSDPRAAIALLRALGSLERLVPRSGDIGVRSLVVLRELISQVSPLADSIFAVQGLGTFPIALAGDDAQRARLPELLRGDTIAAFALTEPEAGSDVASMRTTARRDGETYVLDGEKTLISNVGIADHYIVFANADPSLGKKGITAFIVDKNTAGLTETELPMTSPHPLGSLRFDGARIPASMQLGSVGKGLSIALGTLDRFRVSVGAAANGMAARALDEAIAHVTTRVQFGAPLSDREQVQAIVADMATELDAGRLLVARAAHLLDTSKNRAGTEVAMAKMFATEGAQHVIDKAVQLHGGRGVLLGSEVEALYRDIRPLRIYEGTTEIQKLIIARALMPKA